jgi:Flp pilus assembly protein TadD
MFPSSICGSGLSNRFLFSCALALVSLIIPFVAVEAQSGGGVDTTGTNGSNTIQGRIYLPSGRQAEVRVKVTLESSNSGELSVLSDANGSFSFRSLAPGSYTIVIAGGDDYETVRESIYIDTPAGRSFASASRAMTVPIYLHPKRDRRNSSVPGVLNAALANVPAPARDLYQKALEAARAGDSKRAVLQLHEALSLFPEFPLALNELGVQYLKLGQPDKAATPLQSAVKLAPEAFTPRLNYSIAILNQEKFAEAEGQLRLALSKNNTSQTAHMYLGVALMRQHKIDDAEKELRIAISVGGNEIAIAHYYLGGVLWAKREHKSAADELETYLRLSPSAPDAERTRTAIKELRSKQ